MDWMDFTKFSLEGVVLPIVGVLGVVGNVASIAVLQARWGINRQINFQKKYNFNPRSIDLKKSFCQILTMLAVFDTFFVISAIIAFSLPLISDYWNMVTNNFLICTIFSSLLLPRWYLPHCSPTWCPWFRFLSMDLFGLLSLLPGRDLSPLFIRQRSNKLNQYCFIELEHDIIENELILPHSKVQQS